MSPIDLELPDKQFCGGHKVPLSLSVKYGAAGWVTVLKAQSSMVDLKTRCNHTLQTACGQALCSNHALGSNESWVHGRAVAFDSLSCVHPPTIASVALRHFGKALGCSRQNVRVCQSLVTCTELAGTAKTATLAHYTIAKKPFCNF